MNKTTVKLNSNLKKEYVMKVEGMKLAPPELISIRAWFFLTIGCITMRNWKLTYKNGEYRVSSPAELFTNKNGNAQYKAFIEITDQKINNKILELALAEYNLKKEQKDVNQIEP